MAKSKEINKYDVNSLDENSSDRYILEGDIKYPDASHKLHNDYPLSSEKHEISHNMLPKYCSNIANKYDIKIGGANKIVANLGNKSQYVLHYRNLQLYLSLEMKLANVHKILKYKQSGWLKKYIDFNTDKRKKCCQ